MSTPKKRSTLPNSARVHHDGLVEFAVFALVVEVEARGQVPVELNGGELPHAAEHVDQLDVDFGTVEGGFAGNGLERDSLAVEDLDERSFGEVPLSLVPDELLVFGIPGGELDFEFQKPKRMQDGFGEIDAGFDFGFDLRRHAEDVGVVLGEAANAQQAVHGAGALIAIDVAEFGVALGQVAIAFGRVLVDEDMAGAVHRLEAVLGVVELHGRVHVFAVVCLVAGDLPELPAHDMRGKHHIVTTTDTFFAHPVFHGLADQAALGMPEDEAGSGDLLDGKEVELLAEHAMVASLDLFEPGKVRLEVLFVEEGGAVDALELLVFLVAEPVGAGDGGDFKCLDAAGGRHVRAAAEVGEAAVAVEGDFVARLGEALDEVHLHELGVRFVLRKAFFARFRDALELFVACNDLGHAGFDGSEVSLGEGDLAVNVVEEALVGGGAMAELGLGEELEDGGSHDVGGGVAHDLERGFVLLLEQPEFDVFGEGGW